MNINNFGAEPTKNVFYDYDYRAHNHTFTADAAAGDIVELADGTIGISVHDVIVKNDPNGAVAYRGTVDMRRIEDSQKPTAAQVAKASGVIKWRNEDGTYFAGAVKGE